MVGDVIRRLVARWMRVRVSRGPGIVRGEPQHYNHISRRRECVRHNLAIQGLLDMEGGETVLPFVCQFDGEGGEQGDPLMPMPTVCENTALWRPSTAASSPQRL